VSFQYGCHAAAGRQGEFRYGSAPSQLATLQAVPAVAGVVLPIRSRLLSAAEPRLSCPTN
jgi:hypothetical protein